MKKNKMDEDLRDDIMLPRLKLVVDVVLEVEYVESKIFAI